jgi:hypothetical protein
LQTVLQKPQQRLAGRTELEELAKHQGYAFSNAAIRILFQALILALHITCRGRHDQFTSSGLLAARLYRTLPQ